MTLHLPTLHYISFTVLVASAGMVTLHGRTGQVYRGFWWWVTAQWLLALGMLLNGVLDQFPAALPAANLLLLQWPIVMLGGLRRFYARHEWRVPAAADWLVLAAAFVAWLATWAAHASPETSTTVFSLGAGMVHLHCAFLLSRRPEIRRSSALRVLAATEFGAACVQILRIVPAQFGPHGWLTGDAALLAGGMMMVLSSVVMVYLGLVLSCERTEANLRVTQSKLRFLADMDTLTRVPNRRHFHELAAKVLSSSTASGAALMMFDIDHFKTINDRLGHAMGDNALRHVGRCTREALREVDVAGRLGGDEFAVLLPGTSVDDAMSVAARIVRRLESRQGGPEVSLSFGVVEMQAEESIADALRRADQALYEAKRQGRSRAVAASGEEGQPVFSESLRLGLEPM
jgi:diguanylate cyclase (GGDEF)-like protein